MKKFIATAALLAFLPSSSYATQEMQNFLEQTMQALTTMTPKTYEGQKRGYFIGGSASIKFPNENIQPFSFTPPQLKAGCGGIDIVMGGFSYLNFDYLVQKLQQILQVAPAFAFRLALSTLCKQCDNVISSLDHLANQINQMNLNQCQTEKALAGYVHQKFASRIAGKVSFGKADAWFGEAATLIENFTQDMQHWVDEYSAKYDRKDVHATIQTFQPSLLHNAFEKAGSYNYLEPFVRALVGDWANQISEDNVPAPHHIDECPQAPADAQAILDSLLNGDYWIRNIDNDGHEYACTKVAGGDPFTERIEQKIKCIGYKMSVQLQRPIDNPGSCYGTDLTDEELSLINNLQIPIIPFLRSAIILDDPAVYDETVNKLTEVAALQVAYLSFARIASLSDALISNLEGQTFKLVKPEDVKVYFDSLRNRMRDLRKEAYKRYSKKLIEVRTTYASFLQKQLEMKKIMYEALRRHRLLDNLLFQEAMERGM